MLPSSHKKKAEKKAPAVARVQHDGGYADQTFEECNPSLLFITIRTS
jgi:hypothetical protein